jgi:hypothetical protein
MDASLRGAAAVVGADIDACAATECLSLPSCACTSPGALRLCGFRFQI